LRSHDPSCKIWRCSCSLDPLSMLDTITYARWEACPIVSLHHHYHLLCHTLSLPLLSQIFSVSRSDHVENNSFHAWCMKLSFHQVFIHPQWTPIEWVMPVLLRRWNLSKADFRLHVPQCFCNIFLYGSSNSSILDALEPELDGASDFQLFLPWTCLIRSSKLMKTATSVFEVRWRWCMGLPFLWVWLLSF
jgi:hypothetical protein